MIYLKKGDSKKIGKAYAFFIFIKNCINIFDNYKVSRSFINYIYTCDLNNFKLEDTTTFESEYIWYYTQYIDKYPKFNTIIKKIKEYYDIYVKDNSRYKIVKYSSIKFPKYDLSRRKKIGYKWTTFQNKF